MGWVTTLFTVVGAVVGGIFGQPQLGATIGAFVGAAIEGPPDVDAPTIQEINATGASEGDQFQYFIGYRVPITGELIWRGPQYTKEAAGKEGVYVTRLPHAISFGRTVTGKAAIKIERIYSDNKLFYMNKDAVDVSGTDISMTFVEVKKYDSVPENLIGIGLKLLHGSSLLTQTYGDIESSSTDLSLFEAGADIVVSGFANGGNNGTFKVVSAGTNRVRVKKSDDTTHTFVTEAAGVSVTLFQAGQEFKNLNSGTMEVHLGGPTQTASSIMETWEGVGDVPAYRGETYIVFSNLIVQGRVPTYKAIIRERNSRTLAPVLKDLAVWTGIGTCDIDTYGSAGLFDGYSWRGIKNFGDLLTPLVTCFDLVTQERDLQMFIMNRQAIRQFTIEDEALAAREGLSGAPKDPVEVERARTRDIAATMSFSYLDLNKEWDSGTSTQKRHGLDSRSVSTISVPVVMDTDRGTTIAKRLLYGEDISSQRHKMSLPPSKLFVKESDLLLTSAGGVDRETRTVRVSRGANYVMEVEGKREDLSFYSNDAITGGDSEVGDDSIQLPGDPQLVLADIGPLSNDDVYTPTLYMGGMREASDAGYEPTAVYESLDGTSYTLINDSIAEAVAGFVVGTVPTGPVGYWDLGTEITVEVMTGATLASSTDAEVLAGSANWFVIGGEVIAAVNVESLGSNQYKLTRLLRGLVDTEAIVGLHGSNEQFMQVYPGDQVSKHVFGESDIGTTAYYKAVPQGSDESSHTATSALLAGFTIRPFSPGLPTGTKDSATDDWSGTFEPRTRAPLVAIFGEAAPDLLEDTEDYVVEIWDDSAYTNLIRTITTTATVNGTEVDATAHTWMYDAQDQFDDFGNTGGETTLYVRIYQIGDSGLYSRPTEVTFS